MAAYSANTELISVRLPHSVVKALRQRAREDGVSVAKAIQHAMAGRVLVADGRVLHDRKPDTSPTHARVDPPTRRANAHKVQEVSRTVTSHPPLDGTFRD